MNWIALLPACRPAIVIGVICILAFTTVRSQDPSVADTIAFIIKQHKKPAGQCDALYQLGAYYFNTGQPGKASQVMQSCVAIAGEHDYFKGLYDAWSIIGAIHIRQNNLADARATARQCLQLALKQSNEYGINRANYILAVMYLNRGDLDSLIYISRQVLDEPHVVYDSVTLPKFNAMLGNAYMTKGDFQRAGKCFVDALVIAEKTNNEPLMTVCIGNLAIINESLRNYREALRYLRRAEAMAIRNNQLESLGSAYNSMVACYRGLMLPDSALLYSRLSLKNHRQFGLMRGIAIANSNIGLCFSDLGQPDSAIHYLVAARNELDKVKDSVSIGGVMLALGAVYRGQANATGERAYLHLAEKELLNAQVVLERNALQDQKMKCYHEQAVVYDLLGNESKAFSYLKMYANLSDSIRSKTYTQQIAELQAKYESEKKEMEINRLNAEKALGAEKISRQRIFNISLLAMAGLILASGSVVFRNVQKKRKAEKQVAVLERQNAIEHMRTRIASDVHDEMGASLTRLGLNAQQLLQSPAMPAQEKMLAEKMSTQSREIITGMREIIWSSNPANDNLKSMLGFMRQYIDRFFDGTQIRPVVNFPHDTGEIILHPEVRRNLFLILKESLNNAIKYSGSDHIEIDFRNDAEAFHFAIKDFGQGISGEAKDQFTNGLHNMKMRAEQIQSMFRLVTSPGKGVQVIVEGKLY